MRFGLADDSAEQSEGSSIYSYTSDEDSNDERLPSRYSEPVSHLGRRIRGFVDSSDSDGTSDDDDFAGLPKITRTQAKSVTGNQSQTLWRTGSSVVPVDRKGKGKAVEWDDDGAEGRRNNWIRSAEEEAMREGRKAASERRARLREIHLNARQAVSAADRERTAREEEEMARLLQGLVLQQAKKEEELAKRFADREAKLWADIDAAIQQASQTEADQLAAEAARVKRQKDEAESKAKEAEKEAAERRAKAEAMAKAKVAQDQAEAKRKEEEAVAAKEAEARKAELRQAADSRGKTGTEWRKWVEKQRWMKKEVIEVVKADRATRTGLRTAMRLITRNLGQVTNAKETIVRVSNDIHKLLSEQLGRPPAPASPAVLDSSTPKAYAYLLSHLSKALIKQAESEVSAKSEAAFPLARVVISLLLHGHAALGDVLFARLVKKCPWVIPYYPSRQPDQSREEYEKSTGRGLDESKTEYIARMAGVTTLYFAILQTPLGSVVATMPTSPKPVELAVLVIEPFRLTAAWSWLAHACRDPMPAMEPVAHLVTAWLETLGRTAANVFGIKQLTKALDALQREGIESGRMKGDGEAARQRLALLLEEAKVHGLVSPAARDWE